MAEERAEAWSAAEVAPSRLSWSAIFGGAVTALGMWILLYAFGLAVGLSSLNPQQAGSLKGSGIFTGIWSVVSPLIALFVGGVVAGRGAGGTTRSGGATHGLVMWGLTTVAGLFLVMSAISSLVRGAANLGGAAVKAGTAAVGSAAEGDGLSKVTEQLGLSPDDALAPVNQRLQAEGKPTVSTEQLQATVKDLGPQLVQGGGKIDREALIASVARNTSLSRQDAEEVAGRLEAQAGQAKEAVGTKAQQVQTQVLQVAESSGAAFWGIFGALLLGLVSSVLGAVTGVSRRQRLAVRPGVALPQRREVYP